MPLTSWPQEVAVAVATVAARRGIRDVTVSQWRALGADPVVTEQPAHIPHGYTHSARNHANSILAALHSGVGWVISSEDDIDLDPRIVGALPDLCRDEPVTLWTRPRFVPVDPDRAPGRIGVLPVRHQPNWWGSQAVIMPSRIAETVCAPPLGGDGWDRHLSAVFRTHRWRLWCTDPCLVEHRRVPRIACPRAPYVCGARYEGPITWSDMDRAIWEWLPGRTTRSRMTDSATCANALGYPERDVLLALEAMERAGHVTRERKEGRRASRWYRFNGSPLPLPLTAPDMGEQTQLC